MDHPNSRSRVLVTFVDGRTDEYIITASHHIARHLMENAKETGALIMRDDDEGTTVCIPVLQVQLIKFVTEEGV